MGYRYYQKEWETMSPAELRILQSEKLVAQVRHVYEHVPYYRAKMDEADVTPADVRGVEDLHKLPFLSKSDLRDAYPYGLLAVPKSEVVRIHSTSGTTGKRVIAFYTQGDIDLWEDSCARTLVAAGATDEDIVQVCYGYGLFTGGAGLNGGSQRLGSMTLPMSSGNTERQLQFMMDLGSTVLCSTPSYALYLGEALREQGFAPEDIPLKSAILGGEPWTEEMRRDIEKTLGLRAFDIYGLTEICGPGVAFECEAQSGMHINEDHFIAEIIHPETGEVLPEGEKGELVFTCLDKKAFPMLRYRTRDICMLQHGACPCGRTFVRMCKPIGRSDDMMIIRGVNVFPSQIEAVLFQQGYSGNYQIVVDRVDSTDAFDVYAELPIEEFDDTIKQISGKEKALQTAMKNALGISPKVHLTAPKSLERSDGKATRIIDKRTFHP